jgi:hypothetical protein
MRPRLSHTVAAAEDYEPGLTKYMKISRLKRVQHVIRMDTRPEEKKKLLTPKLRRGNSVDQDIRLPGERNWKSLALYREWKKLLKRARAHTGLSNCCC